MIVTVVVTFIVGAVSLLLSVTMGLVLGAVLAKKSWDWFGKEFDNRRLATLAAEIKAISLPSRTN